MPARTVRDHPVTRVRAAPRPQHSRATSSTSSSHRPSCAHGRRLTRSTAIEYCWPVSVFAAATGIGSWPGTAARDAAEVVVGELHTLAHLVELPARGVGRRHDRPRRCAADRHRHRHRAARLPHRRPAAARWRAARPACSTRTSTRSRRPGRRPGCAAAARRSRFRRPARSRWPRSSSCPAGTARSPTPERCATWRVRSPKASRAHRARAGPAAGDAGGGAIRRAVAARGAGGSADGVTSFSPVHPVDEAWRSSLLDECVAAVGGEVVTALLCSGSAVEGVAAQRTSARFGRCGDADGRRSRRHRRVRRLGPRGDARRGARPARRTAARRPRRSPRRPRRSPTGSASAAIGTARPHRRHAGVRPGRRDRGLGPDRASSWRRRLPTGFAEDPQRQR